MEKIKVIKQLFSKTEAKAVAKYHRQKARRDGRSLKKVEVVSALKLYRCNKGLFSEIGKPWYEHFMVVVYYSKKDEAIRKEDKPCTKVISVAVDRENVTVNLRSFTVIRYVSKIVKGELIKVIERYVVSDEVVKQNKVIPLYSSYSIAS
ncbi:MAG: hypothetical protein KDE33_17695 [Bacteroidetes bacterium]|nr:hypothetical protein [Bacteroidota bacterium]